MKETQRQGARLRYVPALDGMRGISLPGTILTHYALFFAAMPGAPTWLQKVWPFTLNIEMFFALSGALITSLLVSEHQRTDKVSFTNFYVRRSRRLAPALICVVLVMLGIQWFLSGTQGGPPLGNQPWLTAGSLFVFLGNWRMVDGGATGFELGWLGPAWTLGIEEQFYLTWPVLLWLALRRQWRRVEILMAVGIVITICVAASIITFTKFGTTPNFYMTHTHLPPILLGCALGYILTTTPDGRLAQLLSLRSVALFGLGGMALISWQWWDNPRMLTHGGYAIYGAASCLLIGHCMVRAAQPSVIGRVLGWKPFMVIGQLSYEAYLVHIVVILAVLRISPTMNVNTMMVVDAVLIAAISAAFYYGVGKRIRVQGWGALVPRLLKPAPRPVPAMRGTAWIGPRRFGLAAGGLAGVVAAGVVIATMISGTPAASLTVQGGEGPAAEGAVPTRGASGAPSTGRPQPGATKPASGGTVVQPTRRPTTPGTTGPTSTELAAANRIPMKDNASLDVVPPPAGMKVSLAVTQRQLRERSSGTLTLSNDSARTQTVTIGCATLGRAGLFQNGQYRGGTTTGVCPLALEEVVLEPGEDVSWPVELDRQAGHPGAPGRTRLSAGYYGAFAFLTVGGASWVSNVVVVQAV